MSLEGLELPQLTKAFETACSAPGGWYGGFPALSSARHRTDLEFAFWIKYASRDEVELLSQGSNGAEEMRGVAMKELDDSPLYGFIRFRRRNILIKYVPEGTSRVLKARSQVHFQFVTERFSPHDTTYSISSLAELTDSALTSACSTHTATASISSSNSSLRQRKLADIAESADEEDPVLKVDGDSAFPFGVHTASKAIGTQGLAVVVTTHDSAVPSRGPGSPVYLNPERDQPGSPTSSTFQPMGDGLEPRRRSTNSPRPSTTDLYTYPSTPKVRLGPRPHVESNKRPHTAGERTRRNSGSEDEESRPVASVPRSVQIPQRRAAADNTSPRSHSLTSESAQLRPPVPPIPSVHFIPSLIEPPPTPSSVKSLPIFAPPPSQQKNVTDGEPTISPEKQRLLRALQLRKKSMMPELREQAKLDEAATRAANASDAKVHAEGEEDDTQGEENNEDLGLEKVQEPEVIEKSAEPEEGDEGEDKGGEDTAESKEVEKANTEYDQAGKDSQHEQQNDASVSDDSRGIEGTKVRGDPDSDSETEAGPSGDASEADSQAAPQQTSDDSPIPSIAKSFHSAPLPKNSHSEASRSSTAPKTAKRPEKAGRAPSAETPVAETARSVSAPFLKSTRDVNKTNNALPRKVNVSAGSVSQRIRQLEMLSVSKAGVAAQPAKSPPQSRTTSPVPHYPHIRPSSSHHASPPRKNSVASFKGPATPSPPATPNPPPSRPSSVFIPVKSPKHVAPPKVENNEFVPEPEPQVTAKVAKAENSKPDLQVATKTLPQEKSKNSSPKSASSLMSHDFTHIFTRKKSVDKSAMLTEEPQVDPKNPETIPPSSSPVYTASRRQSVEGGPSSIQCESSGMSIVPNVEDIKKENVQPEIQQRVPLVPIPKTKSLKEKKEKEKRPSSSTSRDKSPATSPKSPSLLKRMSSSLSRKKESPPPPEEPIVEEPAKKTYLMAGWVNVQLPDTMLWRRRCMKVDSAGMIFLSLSEDENSLQTRRYHIPTEVRNVDLPDVDEQELPHSVRVTLSEGGTLQCACQNGNEQRNILNVIRGCLV
ncbi:hypothetical protein RUND412_009329 [Rhizina undulata]